MTLTFVSPEEVAQSSATFSGFLYGPEGIGKTAAACSAPDPLLYLNADAPTALKFARRKYKGKQIREVKITPDSAREKLGDAYLYLRDGGEGTKTVVLDPMGRMYDVVLQDLAKDDKHPTLPEHGDAGTFIERYVLSLLELPVNVVLIAHDNPVQVAGAENDGSATLELFPFVGTKNPGLAKKLMRPMDVVAYCGRIDSTEEGKPPRYVGQLFHGGGRRGKDRTDVIADSQGIAELDLSAWAHLNAVAYSGNGSNSKEK